MMMKKTTILSVIAAAAMVPVAVAQESAPTPPAPEAPAPMIEISRRVFVNGKELSPDDVDKWMDSAGIKTVQKLSASVAPTAAPTPAPAAEAAPAAPCPNCAAPKKEAPRPRIHHRRHVHHAAAPSNRPRYYGQPGVDAMPPCAKRHGRVMRSAGAYYPAEANPAPAQPENAKTPKAVKVIINGVEAIVPWGPDGLNFTIKPL